MDKKIKSSATIRVVGNYAAATAVTAAIVGEGLLIGNYKEWADTLSKKKYIGFVGRQAKGIRGGLEGARRSLRSITQGIHRNRDHSVGHVSQSMAERFWKPDIDTVILNTDRKAMHDLIERMQSLHEKYDIKKILPNGLNFSLGEAQDSPGLGNMGAEKVAEALIKKSLKIGMLEPLFFQKYKDGSIGWIEKEIVLKPGRWAEAIEVFVNKQMANVVDLGKDMGALEVTSVFGDFLKDLAQRRS